MSADHHEATLAAMRDAECGRVDALGSAPAYCEQHAELWDIDRDVCRTIGDAVRIGYEAGRRDALKEVETEAIGVVRAIWRRRDPAVDEALDALEVIVRALASTPTNEGADDART